MRDAYKRFVSVACIVLLILTCIPPGAAYTTGDARAFWVSSGDVSRYSDTPTEQWSAGISGSQGISVTNANVTYAPRGSENTLTRIHANGTVDWTETIGSFVYDSAVYDSDDVAYAADDTVGVRNESGGVIWERSTETAGTAWAITTGPDNAVYVGEGSNVVKYDSSGTHVWTNSTAFSTAIETMRTGPSGDIRVGSAGGIYTRIDPDGNEVWTFNAGHDVLGSEIDANGTSYIAISDEFAQATPNITAVDESGNELWSWDAPDDRLTAVTFTDGFVWAAGTELDLYKIDASDGTLLSTQTNEFSVNVLKMASPEQTTAPTPPDLETSLELEIRTWMPFNSTQDYRVILNVTNTTSGDTNLTDVTADANVTIYNVSNTTGFTSPIATVNNTSDTIVSHKSTGQVAVNATWNGNTLGNATTMTVGNRNLSNIGIMPPSQWISSFFEIDEASGGVGLGTPMQWVLFIVLIMATAARMFDNPWAGLGGGMVTGILMWVLQFVGLGVVLATVFSTIFVGLLVLRSRRMSVNVGGP